MLRCARSFTYRPDGDSAQCQVERKRRRRSALPTTTRSTGPSRRPRSRGSGPRPPRAAARRRCRRRPRQVLRGSSAASRRDRRIASAAARRSPETSVRSDASIATSAPVPTASPRSACASAGASLTPSPDHGDDLALRPAAATPRPPCPRAAPRRRRSSMPTAARDRLGGRAVVAGEQHRPQAERAELGDRVRATRLHRVGDDEHARGPRRPSRRGPRSRPRPRPPARGVELAGRHALARKAPRPAATRRRRPRPRRRRPASRRSRRRPAAGRARPAPRARSRGRSGARRRPPARRRGAAPPARSPRRRTSARLMRPVGDGPGLVEQDGVDAARGLEHLGPLMSRPSCAPRAVPTMSAVGVARPSAQGQAMMRTATAALTASPAPCPATSQPASVASASPTTTGTKTAETRSARRWTCALPDWASATSRAICASAVSAPTRVARTTRRPPAFTDPPATSSPGASRPGATRR